MGESVTFVGVDGPHSVSKAVSGLTGEVGVLNDVQIKDSDPEACGLWVEVDSESHDFLLFGRDLE